MAEGTCRTASPGGCMGSQFKGLNDLGSKNGDLLDKIDKGINAANFALITQIDANIKDSLDRLGPKVAGGLSGKLSRFSKWLGIDRVLNIMNTWILIHNAYFLSSNLAQTLFSTVDSLFQAFGLQLKDDEGQSIDFSTIITNTIDSWFKSIFGVETWEGIKTQWKAFSRIYQAGANIISSFRSIGDSILSAMEIVGSQVSKIGNAMKRAGEVAENAFGWMNPSPNFQNRFFTAIERTEEFVSAIDGVAQEVISVQDSIKEIGENRKEMQDALSQLEGSIQGKESPEAQATKKIENEGKGKSVPTLINLTDLIKPAD